MAARIRSLRNGITPIDEASRDDLVAGDVVTVTSLDAATTYAWAIVFAPDGSTATFSGSASAVSPGTFTVDLVGPYLIRLTIDAALPTENTQYVRLRALTTGLSLRLVAAGERRDESGVIPVDVSTEGWANDQNFNLQTLETSIAALTPTLQNAYDGGNDIVLTDAVTPVNIEAGAASPASLIDFQKTGGTALGTVTQSAANTFQVRASDAVGANPGNTLNLRAGDAVAGVQVGGDVTLRPGVGFGGAASGEVRVEDTSGQQYTILAWSPVKRPCRLAATGNVTLAGGAPNTLDGVALNANDRILVWQQTAGAENGIYVVTTVGTGADGTWTRDPYFDNATTDHITAGMLVYIQEGSRHQRCRFTLITQGSITIGVTALEWMQEGPLVRTDTTATNLIAGGTNFDTTNIVWSATLLANLFDVQDFDGVVIYFNPQTLPGGLTEAQVIVQFYPDGTTVALDDDATTLQTDVGIDPATGIFESLNYTATFTTANGTLVAGKTRSLYFPKRGNKFRVGVLGVGGAGGAGFQVDALRIVSS